MRIKGCRVAGPSHLGFGQAEPLGQLLALRPHHVVVPLEGVLQFEQLRRREGGADALRLAEWLEQEICKRSGGESWVRWGL